jgi:hypothetical protein
MNADGFSLRSAQQVVLFVAALFTKGLTHDLLLEAGVFLVSVKLIIMAYKSSVTTKALLEELREVRKDLKKIM